VARTGGRGWPAVPLSVPPGRALLIALFMAGEVSALLDDGR
jgi:hypothetical protein